MTTTLKCQVCEDMKLTKRVASDESPYIYEASGLPDLGLVGIAVHKCPVCGYEVPIIPRIGELHRTITLNLLRKETSLTGPEIRFCRKQASFPQGDFSRLVNVSQEHLSRVENGHKTLGDTAERLARAIVAAVAEGGDEARRILLSISQRMKGRAADRTSQPPIFKLERNHWRKAA